MTDNARPKHKSGDRQITQTDIKSVTYGSDIIQRIMIVWKTSIETKSLKSRLPFETVNK